MLIIQLIHCTERSKEDRVRETHDFLKMPSEFMNNIIIKGFKIKILITKYFKGIYKEKGFSVHTHTHTLFQSLQPVNVLVIYLDLQTSV